MAGIRIGGAAPAGCSPPVTAYDGAAVGDGSPQVYQACSGNAAGTMTKYTDFAGFTDADQCHNPVLSPDGSKILFEVLGATSGFREVWVVDRIPASTPTQLVADGSNYVIHPSWGPDSDTFVYVHCASGALSGGTVYKDTVSSPGSPTSLKAAAGGMSPFRPQLNFDGTRVAYIWDQDSGSGSSEIRCMDDDGTNDASLDNTLTGYRLNQPTMFGWANSANKIVYEDGASGSNAVYVINDDGTGQVQINSAGDAAGAGARVGGGFPGAAWAPNDSYAVISANITGIWSPVRCELDGSDTTQLGTTGAVNQNWFTAVIVFGGRIWFISATDASSSAGRIRSMGLAGTGETENFDSSDGTGDQVAAFVGGDGFFYN